MSIILPNGHRVSSVPTEKIFILKRGTDQEQKITEDSILGMINLLLKLNNRVTELEKKLASVDSCSESTA